MSLRPILSPERNAISEHAVDAGAAIDQLARLLSPDAAGQALVAASLHERERMGSTAIGHGVALPHGRNEAFDATRAAFIRLRHPLDFGAIDGVPVDLLLALSVPAHFTHQHLQLLAGIAERFSEAGLRESLRVAADAEAVYALLTGD